MRICLNLPSSYNLGRVVVVISFRYFTHHVRLDFLYKYLLQERIQICATSPCLAKTSHTVPRKIRPWNLKHIRRDCRGLFLLDIRDIISQPAATRLPLATCSQILSMGTYGNKVQAAKSAWGSAGTLWWASPHISPYRGTRPLHIYPSTRLYACTYRWRCHATLLGICALR